MLDIIYIAFSNFNTEYKRPDAFYRDVVDGEW